MKRLLAIAFACVLIGAVSNIALAWWLAYARWDTPLGGTQQTAWTASDGPGWWYRRYDAWGSVRIEAVGVTQWTAGGNTAEQPRALPSGSIFDDPPHDPSAGTRMVADIRGWPLPALSSVYEATRNPNQYPSLSFTIIDGREIDVSSKTGAGPGAGAGPGVRTGTAGAVPPAYPTRILWSGFLINTFAHAGIWFVLATAFIFGLSAALTHKKRRRLKRGECLVCGYDLRGSVERGCPECGWQREPAS